MNISKSLLFVALAIFTYYAGNYLVKRNTLRPETEIPALIVGTCDDYPPYTFQKDGRLAGFDIDLITEVGKRMSKNIEFKNISFDLLLLETVRGSIHVVAAGLTPTAERAKLVNFSKPYVKGTPFIIVSSKNAPLSTIEALKNKQVGVNEGYTSDTYLSQFSDISIQRFENVAMGMLALTTGKIDAFVTGNNSIQLYLEQHNPDDFALADVAGTEETSAFALSKQHPELVTKINNVLTELEDDGTLEDLKKYWGIQ